jgi:cobalt-zinc-cadmium efflux system outer membrane protein
VDVAAADRITADTLPNPSVSYGGTHLVQGLSTGALTQHQIVAEQPLLIFGQRQARRDAAELNVSAERARVAAALADRRLEVRQAFVTLLARQEDLRLLQNSRADLGRVEAVVRGRADAGDRSRYDVLRIETEGQMLDIDVRGAVTDVADASRHLAQLLGFPEWEPHAEGMLGPGATTTDFDVLWAAAQRRRPGLVAIQRRVSAAQGGILLAQHERLPVPAVSGGALKTNDVAGTSVFFGFSVPLPFFDRGHGPIARATAEANAETLAATAEVGEARAEVERTRVVFMSRRQTLASVEGDLVQRVPVLRRMAEDAYREGRGDILELLDASRSLKDIQLLHVKQLELTSLAEEEVIAAAGLDAAETP